MQPVWLHFFMIICSMKSHILILVLCFPMVLAAQNSTLLQNALRNYDYEKALILLSKERRNAEVDFQKARCLRNLNRYDEAIDLLLPLSKDENSTVAVVIELAQCYEAVGNLRQAAFFYRMGLDDAPANRFLQLKYLNLKFQLREWDETIRLGRSLLTTDTVAGVLPLLADCYMQINNTDSAGILYKQSIQKFPADYTTVMKLARLCVNANKTEQLVQVTGNYLQLDSANAGVNLYNGIGYFMKKEYPRALSRIGKAYGLGDKTFLTNYYMGATYLALQEYGDAYQYLSKAFVQDSSNINLHYYLSKAGIYSGNSQKVMGILHRAVDELMPGDTVMFNYHYLLSEGYARLFNYPMQINELNQCYRYKPDFKYALYCIASIYDTRLRKPEEAVAYYIQYLAKAGKPKTNDLQSGLSCATAAENRLKEIQEELKKKVR